MLVSPLMGPIVALTLGTAIRDWELVRKGIRNEAIGIGLTFLVGLIWGVCVAWWPEFWNQNEELSRATLPAVYLGLVVAIPSGAGVAIATTQGGGSALVGVAISAALLPPISNSASMLVYGLILLGRPDLNADTTASIQLWQAMYSMCLFLVNFIGIYFTALVFFRIKGISGDYISMKKHSHWQDPEASMDLYGPDRGGKEQRERLSLLQVEGDESDDVRFH